jgi:hypothetical protein
MPGFRLYVTIIEMLLHRVESGYASKGLLEFLSVYGKRDLD